MDEMVTAERMLTNKEAQDFDKMRMQSILDGEVIRCGRVAGQTDAIVSACTILYC